MTDSLVKGLFDKTLTGLQRSMDLRWQRNQAIATNISNAETPGYRALELNFSGELEKAFGSSSEKVLRTDARHLDLSTNTSAHLTPDYSGATKPDGNNVDLDLQMGRLTDNSSAYGFAANVIRKKLTLIRSAITSSQS